MPVTKIENVTKIDDLVITSRTTGSASGADTGL